MHQEADLHQGLAENMLVNIGLSARRDLELVSGKKCVIVTHLAIQKSDMATRWLRISEVNVSLCQTRNGLPDELFGFVDS
jgi:hypothetical protein